MPSSASCGLPDGAAARWALRGTSIPYFVAAHGTEVFKDFTTVKNSVRTVLAGGLKRRVFQEAAKVFPVSHYTRRAVIDEAAGTRNRVITVNNGVNPRISGRLASTAPVQAEYKPHGERILLTVTRLYPYKGVDRMLESLPAILRAVPDVKYLVVGVGPDRPRLEALTARLGLQPRCVF